MFQHRKIYILNQKKTSQTNEKTKEQSITYSLEHSRLRKINLTQMLSFGKYAKEGQKIPKGHSS